MRPTRRVKPRHGHASANGRTPEYLVWNNMMSRCYSQNASQYAYYGAKGIRVCERWHSFPNFLADMGRRPKGLTLDRYPDKAGNYEPGNCRWVTMSEQCRNTARNINLTINGVTQCAKDWAKVSGLKPLTIYQRLKRGWPAERAVFEPPTPKDKRWIRSPYNAPDSSSLARQNLNFSEPLHELLRKLK